MTGLAKQNSWSWSWNEKKRADWADQQTQLHKKIVITYTHSLTPTGLAEEVSTTSLKECFCRFRFLADVAIKF